MRNFQCVLVMLYLVFIIVVNSKNQYKRDEAYDSLDNSSIESESNELFRENVKSDLKRKEVTVHFKTKNITDNIIKANNRNKNKADKALKSKIGSIKYPFSVSIQRKGTHYATGALIDRKWVLTVAGEFYNVRESIKFFRVRLGTVNCKKGGTLTPIKSVDIHPSYKYYRPSYDVALLRLATAVQTSDTLRPIPLSRIKGKVLSAKFLATYWPRLIVKSQVLPSTAQERVQANSMRVSTQKMIPWSWCHSLMSTLNYTLDESSLCLDPIMSHHSLCLPDAGAPVTADDGLWGVTSGWTSQHCLSQPSPTIFTRISSTLVRAWLDSKLTGL